MTTNELLNTYVGHVLDRIDTSGLRAEELEAHRRQLQEELAARVGVIVLEALNEQDRQAYVDMFVATETQDSPEAQQYLKERLPDMAQVINQGAEEFAAEYFAALEK